MGVGGYCIDLSHLDEAFLADDLGSYAQLWLQWDEVVFWWLWDMTHWLDIGRCSNGYGKIEVLHTMGKSCIDIRPRRHDAFGHLQFQGKLGCECMGVSDETCEWVHSEGKSEWTHSKTWWVSTLVGRGVEMDSVLWKWNRWCSWTEKMVTGCLTASSPLENLKVDYSALGHGSRVEVVGTSGRSVVEYSGVRVADGACRVDSKGRVNDLILESLNSR